MMKNKIFTLVLIFLCFENTIAFAKELSILTTIRPIYGLVKAVSGDKNQIEILVGQNQSPHDYNIKPSDILKIKSANLIFMIGDNFELNLSSYLKKKPPQNKVIKFSQNPQIILLKNRESFDLLEDDASDHHHSHDLNDYDMHFWLDPDNAQVMVKEIANTLASLDPENSKFYQTNATKFNNELKTLDHKLKNMFIKHNESFIVFHDAYQYFSKHYHLQNVGAVIINHNITPGIKTMQELQNIIEENNVKCIFAEPQFSPRLVKRIAEETNIHVGIIDGEYGEINSKENAYLTMLNKIAENMSKCFNSSY
ncbi:MAG: metal ABC transporter substrate-binding protein [Alphaproteobacteria bacterium]|jgi:zinc transport system substrate-binding protein